MTDPRLSALRDAIVNMAKGNFHVNVPADGSDEVAQLGQALLNLSRTFEHRVNEKAKLQEVTANANAGLLLDEILDQLYESFRSLIPYDRIGLALLEDKGQVLRARWGRSDAPVIRLTPGFSAPMQGSSLQTVFETGQPRIINDLQSYLEGHPHSQSTGLIVREGMRSSLTCPLIAVGKPIGFIFFSSMMTDTYRDAHVQLFMQIANQLAVIVEKSRLYEELQESNRKLQEANEKLARLASSDGLTGVANRRIFDERLAMEWRRAIRNQTPISLLLIDVDFFKSYNDYYGHLAGDDCLRLIARVVSEKVRRPADLVARYGGEEFVVLLPESSAQSAAYLAEVIRTGIEIRQMAHSRSPVGFITISLGVATVVPRHGTEATELITAADTALYRAKSEGRNQVQTATSS